MQAPRSWVLDLDGTLANTLPDLLGALNEALAEQGTAPVALSFARANLNEGIDAMLAAAAAASKGCGDLPALGLAFERHYAARLTPGAQCYTGADIWVRRHVRDGARLAVCTNRSERMASLLLESLGFNGCFSIVVGADTCGWRKPHPAPLHFALDALGASPQDAVLVGDSAVDAMCAHSAGVAFWLHAGGYGDAAVARTASRVFWNWDELDR